jgi:hypothetical protein
MQTITQQTSSIERDGPGWNPDRRGFSGGAVEIEDSSRERDQSSHRNY